jgi:hypothetical protein
MTTIKFILFSLLGWSAAHAAPVAWEFNSSSGYTQSGESSDWIDGLNGVFAGSVTGSFVYDADAAADARISDVSVNAFGDTFTSGTDCSENGELFDAIVTYGVCLSGAASGKRFIIATDAALTNTGGERNLLYYPAFPITTPVYAEGNADFSAIVSCSDLEGWCYSRSVSSFVSGSLSGTVVPIPAAVWLFVSALAGLGWIRRRQSA